MRASLISIQEAVVGTLIGLLVVAWGLLHGRQDQEPGEGTLRVAMAATAALTAVLIGILYLAR